MEKDTVIRITDALGVEAICKEIGVGKHAVRYVRMDGMFPASWYAGIKKMSDASGLDCPLCAFNWRGNAGQAQTDGAPA